MRKGQTFIVGAVIFSSLILLTSFSFQRIFLQDQGSSTQFYYENSLDKTPEILREELRENYSVENVKEGFYSFNSFLNTQSKGKAIEYSGFQVIILPEVDKVLIINYRKNNIDVNVYLDNWNNRTIEARQNIILNGQTDPIYMKVDRLDIKEKFNASNPRLLAQMEMETDSETWKNYILR